MNAQNILIGAGIGWLAHTVLVQLMILFMSLKENVNKYEFVPSTYIIWLVIFVVCGSIGGALK